MYTREDVINLLDDKGISYEKADHPKAYTMEELQAFDLPYPNRDAKNVFVRDRKKNNYFLITIRGHKRVDLHAVREKFGTSRLSFASDEDLDDILGVELGSVSPFTLLNDTENKVQFVLDDEFKTGNEIIAAHPNENTATLYLNVHDLVDLLEETDHSITWIPVE